MDREFAGCGSIQISGCREERSIGLIRPVRLDKDWREWCNFIEWIEDIWLHPSMLDKESLAPDSPEPDWASFGVGSLSEDSGAPPVDEALVLRFLSGSLRPEEAGEVRSRLARFREWRMCVVDVEASAKRYAVEKEGARTPEAVASSIQEYRRFLSETIEFEGLDELAPFLRGKNPENRLLGPPLKADLLERAMQGPPAASLETLLLVAELVLTYREWHQAYLAFRSELVQSR